MIAMGRAPWCAFTELPIEYCATAGDSVPAPVILHDSASRGVRKIARMHRRLRALRIDRAWRWMRSGRS
jgi:hypothetical protein